jgi:hypothetical protein
LITSRAHWPQRLIARSGRRLSDVDSRQVD